MRAGARPASPRRESAHASTLLAAGTMQFRPWPVEQNTGTRRKPLAQVLEPRSAYIIRGPSRMAWQHHIPAIKSRRFTITFRTLRRPAVESPLDDLPISRNEER